MVFPLRPRIRPSSTLKSTVLICDSVFIPQNDPLNGGDLYQGGLQRFKGEVRENGVEQPGAPHRGALRHSPPIFI